MSGEEEKISPSVYEHLAKILEHIASVSWQKLGLQPDIITGKTEMDLAQAKVAIDVSAYLAKTIDPQLDESDRRTVQNIITSLRMNFVQKSQEAEQ